MIIIKIIMIMITIMMIMIKRLIRITIMIITTCMTSIRLPQLETTLVWRLDGGEEHILIMMMLMMMTMMRRMRRMIRMMRIMGRRRMRAHLIEMMI